MKNLLLAALLFVNGLSLFGQSLNCNPLNIVSSESPNGCILCDTETFKGRNGGFVQHDQYSENFPCSGLETGVFLTFIPNGAGMINMSFGASNCRISRGLEFAIFDHSLNPITGCKKISVTGATTSYMTNNLTPGEAYFLVIDGVEGDLCDFELNVSGLAEPVISNKEISEIRSDIMVDGICQGKTACFSIDEVDGASHYFWEIPSQATIVSQSDLEVCLQFGQGFSKKIKVTPIFGCLAGKTVSKQITVHPSERRIFEISMCTRNFPVEIDGHFFTGFGTHFFHYKSQYGCDSLAQYELVKTSAVGIEMDTFLCIGTALEVNGQFITEESTHSLILPAQNELDCDTSLTMHLKFAEIPPPPEFLCYEDTFVNLQIVQWTQIPMVSGYEVIANGEFSSGSRHFYTRSIVENEPLNITVKPFNAQNCNFPSASHTCFQETTSTIDILKNEKDLVKVFPNPTSGLFQIKSPFSISEINVFDLSGKEIFQTKSQELDLTNSEAGIYILKIQTDIGIVRKKILKY